MSFYPLLRQQLVKIFFFLFMKYHPDWARSAEHSECIPVFLLFFFFLVLKVLGKKKTIKQHKWDTFKWQQHPSVFSHRSWKVNELPCWLSLELNEWLCPSCAPRSLLRGTELGQEVGVMLGEWNNACKKLRLFSDSYPQPVMKKKKNPSTLGVLACLCKN